MAISRLVTLAIEVGNRDAVWLGAVVSRSAPTGIQYRYEPWYGRRRGVLQTLRNPRPWGLRYIALEELARVATEKEQEGYQHIDWTNSYYDLRGKVRDLASGDTVPETRRTGPTNPTTFLPAAGAPAVTPHLFAASTRRTPGGDSVCGLQGCNQVRGDTIHTSLLARHSFLMGASGFCIDCRQERAFRMHQQPTLAEQSAEFATAQAQIWASEGSHPHVFDTHPVFVSPSNRPLCMVCGSVSTTPAHDDRRIREAWQVQRGENWRRSGSRAHVFQTNAAGYASSSRGLLCDVCGFVQDARNGAHQNTEEVRRWQQLRHHDWEDTGRERHDFIPSSYNGTNSGETLCIVCGLISQTSNGSHTGRTNTSTDDRFRYADLHAWKETQYQAWVAGGRTVHAFKASRYANPIKRSGITLCNVCGLLPENRERNHGSDKPATPIPHQYEPVVRRRRPEPGF